MYIERIQSPADVKRLSVAQLTELSAEIRKALLQKISAHGGHFGPNFGMVEATIALHYVFDSPTDKFVFDVSHQSYVHKILTGRAEAFLNPKDYDEVSGYTEPHESAHDFFVIGHTSTSLSLAGGLVKGRDLQGGHENVIAIIGDGSLSGGEALEGLDFAGSELNSNFIIVVNDNQMSIAENHGGLYKNLKELRESNGSCSCNLFKAMGLDYRYVADGNDLPSLIRAFSEVKDINHPVVVHINTLKGKGFKLAEEHKEEYHYRQPFDPVTGRDLHPSDDPDYSDLTAEYLLARMKEHPELVAITAGTPDPVGFTPERRQRAGKQYVDVGIAEEHAVALSSGIAKAGGKPVFSVVSTFIQRAYDQLSQDLCINNNPATLLVYWGTLTGMNDVTHLCFFDIPLISNIPNMVYLAPVGCKEYFAMLAWSLKQREHPVAIRVPLAVTDFEEVKSEDDYGQLNRYQVTREGSRVAILALGSFYPLGRQVADKLAEEAGIQPTLINPRYITGIDAPLMEQLKAAHQLVITLEDGALDGGFGEKIARHYGTSSMKVLNFGARKEFVDRFDREEFLKQNHLTVPQIVEDVLNVIRS